MSDNNPVRIDKWALLKNIITIIVDLSIIVICINGHTSLPDELRYDAAISNWLISHIVLKSFGITHYFYNLNLIVNHYDEIMSLREWKQETKENIYTKAVHLGHIITSIYFLNKFVKDDNTYQNEYPAQIAVDAVAIKFIIDIGFVTLSILIVFSMYFFACCCKYCCCCCCFRTLEDCSNYFTTLFHRNNNNPEINPEYARSQSQSPYPGSNPPPQNPNYDNYQKQNLNQESLDQSLPVVDIQKSGLKTGGTVRNIATSLIGMVIPTAPAQMDDCAICFGDYSKDDVWEETKCRHLFHKICIENWIKTQLSQKYPTSCPLCRAPLLPSNDVNTNTNIV
jgi:hypothetical protein